jgi:hypothetical protein
MQRMKKQVAADDADDKPVKKRLDRPIKRATGGAVPNYIFATPGSSLTAPSSTPGGTGLIPSMRFAQNKILADPKGTPAPPVPNPSHSNVVDTAKQLQTTIGDASKWFTSPDVPTSSGVNTDSNTPDPTRIGGPPYARGGVVPKKMSSIDLSPARGAKRVPGKGVKE